MKASDRCERFVQCLTGCQGRLFSYILSMLPDPDRAAEVLQESNLVLWRKRDEFDWKGSFTIWACSVAKFQVLAFLRDQGRERLFFNDALVNTIADEALARNAASNDLDKRRALRSCVGKLKTSQRELLESRYNDGNSIQALAQKYARPAGSIAQSLYRIRRALLKCLKHELGGALGS